MTTSFENGDLIAFCVIGSISIFLSSVVIIGILRIGLRSKWSQLIFFLQLTLLLAEVFSFPSIYTGSVTLCKADSALRQYFTISNLVANCFLSFATYPMIFSSLEDKNNFSMLAYALIILVPIPFLFGFAAYGQSGSLFCSFNDTDDGTKWNLAFMVCGAVINLTAIGANAYIISKLLKDGKQNMNLIYRVMRGSTLYCLFTVGFWIPKLFTLQFGEVTNASVGLQTSPFFTFFTGFAYFLIFVVERENMVLFESQLSDVPSDGSIQGSINLSILHRDSLM